MADSKYKKKCKKNQVIAELTEVFSGIDWPTVIKPFPLLCHDIMTIATLSGEIWLLVISKDSGDGYLDYERVKFLNISDYIGQLGLKHSGIKFRNATPAHSFGLYEERGLLGMEFDPNFNRNGRFYLYYSLLDDTSISPEVVPVNPLKPATLRQSWTDFSRYSHVNTLEEWNCCVCDNCKNSDYLANYQLHRPIKTRTLLQIKQPFHNHNGFNNLVWDSELRSLLLITGDGGYLNDPFNLAQNLDFPHGKILSIIPSAITGISPPIAKLSELPENVRSGISIISNGLRQSHGLSIVSNDASLPGFTRRKDSHDRTIDRKENTRLSAGGVEYFLTHNGEGSGEGLYRYNPRENIQQTPLKQIVNIGWAGWDNGQPNMASTNPDNTEIFRGLSTEMIISKTVLVSWNDSTNFSKLLEINEGDTLRFLSTDGKPHNLYLIEPFNADSQLSGWRLLELIQDTTVGMDILYRPTINNRIRGNRNDRTIWFLSTEERGFRLGVNIRAKMSLTTDLSKEIAISQNIQSFVESQFGSLNTLDANLPIVLYPRRIQKNKLLPYFRYPHILLETSRIRNVLVGIEHSSPWFIESLITANEFGDSLVVEINPPNFSGIPTGMELGHILYERRTQDNTNESEKSGNFSNSDSDEPDASGSYLPEPYGTTADGGRYIPSKRFSTKSGLPYKTKYASRCFSECKSDSCRPYDGRKCESSCEESSESLVEEATIGNRITGVTKYRGDSILQEGMIVSEWNHKLTNYLSSNLGALYWVNMDPEGRRRFRSIIPKIIQKEPLYFVSLGSNRKHNRLFVGTYSTPFAGDSRRGSVMEIKINLQ